MAVGVARRGGDVDVAELARAAELDAAGSPPAEDVSPPLGPTTSGRCRPGRCDFDSTPGGHRPVGPVRGVGRPLRGVRPGPPSGHVLAGFAEHDMATVYLGSSTGIRLAHAQPTGAMHLVGRSPDGAGSAWAGTGTTDFADISVEGLEDGSGDRLAWASRRVECPAGRYEVILPPVGRGRMMVGLAFELSGRRTPRTAAPSSPDRRRHPRRRAADLHLPFMLCSDPVEPGSGARRSSPSTAATAEVSVFDNGLPLARTDWIAGGRLARLRYHRAGAARSGVEPAGYIDNLILERPRCHRHGRRPGGPHRAGAAAHLPLVHPGGRPGHPAADRADPRRRLRDGGRAVVGAANNFRFNESPVDLLARATEVGTSVRALGREFGEYLNRTPDAAAAHPRLQHELGEPGQLIRGRRRPPSPVPPLCVRARNGVRRPDGQEESLVETHFPAPDRAFCGRYVASGGLPTVGPDR